MQNFQEQDIESTRKRIKAIDKEIQKLNTYICSYEGWTAKSEFRREDTVVASFEYYFKTDLDRFLQQFDSYKGKGYFIHFYNETVDILAPESDESYDRRCLKYEKETNATLTGMRAKVKELQEERITLKNQQKERYKNPEYIEFLRLQAKFNKA